jgi:HlyD family secretion protein
MSQKKRIALYASMIATLIVALLAARYAISYRATAGDPVAIDDLWTDTAKRGQMRLDVRGTGRLTRSVRSGRTIVNAEIREAILNELRINQEAEVDTRQEIVTGRVTAIGPPDSSGKRSVEIALPSALHNLPHDLQVDVTVEIAELNDVLYIGRPVHAKADSSMNVFRLLGNGESAERVNVKFGRAAVNTIEVLDGLREGDRILVGDMSAWDSYQHIRLK